jgi:hypothetical protein
MMEITKIPVETVAITPPSVLKRVDETCPDVIVYHTRFRMSTGMEIGSKIDPRKLNDFGRLLCAIPGVINVQVCVYQLVISKAPLFAWNEICPAIDGLLANFSVSQTQMELAVLENEAARKH